MTNVLTTSTLAMMSLATDSGFIVLTVVKIQITKGGLTDMRQSYEAKCKVIVEILTTVLMDHDYDQKKKRYGETLGFPLITLSVCSKQKLRCVSELATEPDKSVS